MLPTCPCFQDILLRSMHIHMNRESEDFIKYKSLVPSAQLVPAQQLHWNISPESAEDIEAAKLRIDK